MGGVGKTTLLTQINNRLLSSSHHYDHVLWIVVSKDTLLLKIIDDIGAKLGFCGEEWKSKEERDKSIQIYNFLRTTRFVLFLDDIWTKVDLAEIGVPVPTTENRCKIAFTTRSLDVCARMGVRDPICVQCLEPDEAFELFRKKVGEHILRSDAEIRNLAVQVVERCCGLPLALNVVGETMASKETVQEWKHALDVLTNYAAEFFGMEDIILPVLKFSYDSLEGEHIKSCFKYLAMKFRWEREQLIFLWISEGFIDDSRGIERAKNEGHAIIETFLRASLVMEFGRRRLGTVILLHDVIRDLALWLLSDCGKSKNKAIVLDKFRVPQMPALDLETVTWMSLSLSGVSTKDIDRGPQCPNLSTLFLAGLPSYDSRKYKISQDFFRHLEKLAVLSWWSFTSSRECPDGPREYPDMSWLVSLRSLSLRCRDWKHLPLGLLELTGLMYLDLSSSVYLESVAGISKLLGLKLLWLRDCGAPIDIGIVEELALLEHLQDLEIRINDSTALEKLVSFPRLANVTSYLMLTSDENLPRTNLVWNLRHMEKLSILQLICIFELDVKIVEYVRTSCFPNLTLVTISEVRCTKDLGWIVYATSLATLDIRESSFEELITREQLISAYADDLIPFGKLNTLKLHCLPNLQSICQSALEFPFLRKLSIRFCPKLKRLPLNSKSVADLEGLVLKHSPKVWIEDIEWEDEATKQRFSSSCIGKDSPTWRSGFL